MHYDVFNGDADGIIALVQLRLAQPKETTLVTGVKRDISLLKQVDIESARSVTVLDISMEKNIESLEGLLAKQVPVFYVDHHRTGEMPVNEGLEALIDLDANTCTSLLVNQYLNEQYYLWAIAAAFGDNMNASAKALADKHNVSDEDQRFLKALGIYINYNGYGSQLSDLHFPPAELFKLLLAYENPLELRTQTDSVFYYLERAYKGDMANAEQATVHLDTKIVKVIELPNHAWSRRVSGVLGNALANQSPDKAHGVLTLNEDNSYTVSVRAPLNNKQGADKVCTQFDTGGGRAAAAGINQLPACDINRFIETLTTYYS
ncbi:DHH family phosphoesterase [Thalassotalea sp. M1531]|uniref:DHH family phosphoesterase n=1 Tax=Thalassotalea algicola TaxID=2716224 RepID=A0A7Y0LGV0_9GAMM|nr:DHH family phosphoesterase [Thalassotalea algicola]NMP32980.1 DHH family phosphoesterase [Thalassotalea algicola]